MKRQTDTLPAPSAIDFVIGLFITLAASIVNALGLNISKLDFTRQEALPVASRREDWKRGLWWLGLTLYIASQLVGSTLALEYLRAEYVAPLGATSLIFNFIFAYLLVGTPIASSDLWGTLTIVFGVIGTVVFGNIRTLGPDDFDAESNLSLSLLKQIWARGDWIAYLTCLEVTTAFFFWFSLIANEVCHSRVSDERDENGERDAAMDGMLGGGGGRRTVDDSTGFWAEGKRWFQKGLRVHKRVRKTVLGFVERWSASQPEENIRKVAGLCWSITGGLLAGQTLVFAKSAVKLVTSALNHSDPTEPNQFSSPLSWIIIILLVVAAVTQVYCLNKSLKCFDSTFCVPIFFATYTTCGFINSLVYLDEFHTYQLWTFLLIWLSIAILIAGVAILSLKRPVLPKRKAPILADEDNPDSTETGEEEVEPVKEDLLKGKGRGWLGKMIRADGAGRAGVADGEGLEMSRRERRGRKGTTKLVDEEEEGLREEEGEEDPDKAIFDAEDFGEFKAAEGQGEHGEERAP